MWMQCKQRHLEGVVGKPVGVRVPPSAPDAKSRGCGRLRCAVFVCVGFCRQKTGRRDAEATHSDNTVLDNRCHPVVATNTACHPCSPGRLGARWERKALSRELVPQREKTSAEEPAHDDRRVYREEREEPGTGFLPGHRYGRRPLRPGDVGGDVKDCSGWDPYNVRHADDHAKPRRCDDLSRGR